MNGLMVIKSPRPFSRVNTAFVPFSHFLSALSTACQPLCSSSFCPLQTPPPHTFGLLDRNILIFFDTLNMLRSLGIFKLVRDVLKVVSTKESERVLGSCPDIYSGTEVGALDKGRRLMAFNSLLLFWVPEADVFRQFNSLLLFWVQKPDGFWQLTLFRSPEAKGLWLQAIDTC